MISRNSNMGWRAAGSPLWPPACLYSSISPLHSCPPARIKHFLWRRKPSISCAKFDKWQVKIEICQQRLTKHIRFPSSSNIPYHRCIMCFTFCATQQAAPVCVFTHLRIIRIVFLPGAHLRPKGPIAVSWARQPTKRQRAGENILPKWAMRKIRAWISLVSSESVHSDRYECPSSGLGGRGASAFCQKIFYDLLLRYISLMTAWYLCIVVQKCLSHFLVSVWSR